MSAKVESDMGAQPDPGVLLERLHIEQPLIGLYDAPDPGVFEPLVRPGGGRTCMWTFYEDWRRGATAHFTADQFGCGGFGRTYFEVEMRSREEFLSFLADEEGLRASRELMGEWIDSGTTRPSRHGNILIGPWRPDLDEYLLSVTFLVDPDQLSALVIGANYHAAPGDPHPVLAPFGAGCGEMCVPFESLDVAQAVIGATDIAMRQHLPANVLAFTVTKPMFRRLCSLDERSFLFKPFLTRLQKARARQTGKQQG
jgi:Uncharacterised ArCR, COG2043